MSAWYYAWTYRIPIPLSYSSALTSVQVQLDIAFLGNLTAAGKLQADCDDLRFTDSADDPLAFYTEVCDTSDPGDHSLVWLDGVILSAPTNTTTVYMFYGNAWASSESQTWTGKIYSLFDTLAAGWTDDLSGSYAGYFSVGASAYGATGGSVTHTHTGSGSTNTGAPTADTGPSGTGVAAPHSHTVSSLSVSNANNLPPYRDVIFGGKASWTYAMIPANTIIIMDGSIPAGFSQYTNLDSKLPRIAAASGGTGGAASHSHATVSGNLDSTTPDSKQSSGGSGYDSATAHTHTFSSSTDSQTLIPAWFGAVFISSTSAKPLSAGMVALFTVLPPIGWTRDSAADSRYLYGQNTYGTTGGSNTNTHGNVVVSSTAFSGTQPAKSGSGNPCVGPSHTHTVTVALDSGNHAPLSLSFIVAERYNSLPSVSFGAEENVAITYTTITTSATITSLFTSTTFTSVTSTLTSLTTSTTVLTNMPLGGAATGGVERVGISASRWAGVVNQTQTVFGTVSVTAVGSGSFSITNVQFSKDEQGNELKWIALNETLKSTCGCYAVLNSFSPANLRVRISPGADVDPKVWSVGMLVSATTSNAFTVVDETTLIITVGSILPAAEAYGPAPGGFTLEQVQMVSYGATAVAAMVAIASYAMKKRLLDLQHLSNPFDFLFG